MKLFISASLLIISISISSHGVAQDKKIIRGSKDTAITMSHWEKKTRAWAAIEYRSGSKTFPLYELILPTDTPTTVIDTSSGSVSPDKKFIIIQRTAFGLLFIDKHNYQNTEKTYCDVINMASGCMLLTRPAEYCSGTWEQGKWQTDSGETVIPTLETFNPANILSDINNLPTPSGKAAAIKEHLYMGVESYLACHPPQENVQSLNDLAFFLAEGGDNYIAMKLYRAIEQVSPSRTVLKLNIADALWADGKANEAQKYYADYKALMEEAGRSKKVPARVTDRLNRLSK